MTEIYSSPIGLLHRSLSHVVWPLAYYLRISVRSCGFTVNRAKGSGGT